MRLKWGYLVVIVVLACGCAKKTDSSEDKLFTQSGYVCTANNINSHKTFSAWAQEGFSARAYALSRCQSRSRNGIFCKIKSCVNTASTTEVSNTRWYTCYITNHKQKGVWTSTSHNRITSVKVAFERCQRYSHYADSCYLSYCRLW